LAVAILFALGLVMAAAAIRDWVHRRNDASRRGLASAIALGWLASAACRRFSPIALPTHCARYDDARGFHDCGDGCSASVALSRANRRIPRIAFAAVLIAMTCYQAYHTYFDLWAPNPKVAVNFMASLADFAERIRTVPATAPRYIAATYTGDLANGIPVLLQPFAYLTRTYTAKGRTQPISIT